MTTKCCRRLKQELQAASYHKHEAIGEAAWEDYLSDLAEGCLRLQLMGVHHLSPVKVAVGEGTENARGKIQIKKKKPLLFTLQLYYSMKRTRVVLMAIKILQERSQPHLSGGCSSTPVPLSS